MVGFVKRARDALATSAMEAIATYAVTSSVPAVLTALITTPRPARAERPKERSAE